MTSSDGPGDSPLGLLPWRREAGVALVAVLWMVSALSLLSAALAGSITTELRVARQFADHAQAAALGDAAIRLAAAELLFGEGTDQEIRSGQYRIDDRVILVRALPSAGFINVNTASEALLRSMFHHGAGLGAQAAGLLARSIVQWRNGLDSEDDGVLPRGGVSPPGNRPLVVKPKFSVPEDLLQVPGLDLDVFDRIREVLTVHPSGGAGVNPRLAKREVLLILADGDAGVVESIMGRRRAGDPLTDMTGLVQRHLSSGMGSAWRIEAFVPNATGRHFLRAQWISLETFDRLPWRTLVVEPVVVATLPS